MSDIAFHCVWCRHRLVVDDGGAGVELPCPVCGTNITIPPKPVWLPAINEALRRIVQDYLSGTTRNTRGLLREAIIATGYDPVKACVEPNSPDDLLMYDRLNLVLDTNMDVALGYGQFAQAQQDVEFYPAWELFRAEDREVPRGDPSYKGDAAIGWEERWEAAAAEAGDDDALACLRDNGRMVALKDSGIWDALADGWQDSLGNPYPPFAWGSGMDVQEISNSEASALGLMEADEKIEPREIVPPRPISIEDERITEFLWNKPCPCGHCGKDQPRRLLRDCDECEDSICQDCTTKGCSGPEPPPEPRDAIQCYGRAVDETAGLKFPFERDVAERLVHWCSRAFEFGFAAHHRDIEALAHRMLGEAFESLGEKERALREYELAVEKDPQVGVTKRIAFLRKEGTKL